MSDADLRHVVFVPEICDSVPSGIFAESPAEFYFCVDYCNDPEDDSGEALYSSKGIKVSACLLLCSKLGMRERGYILLLSYKSGKF